MHMKSRELLCNLSQSCTDNKSVAQLHSLLLRLGLLPSDCFFATRLTSSYSSLSSTDYARKLFDETPQPNTYLWNAILRAHSKSNQWVQTLHFFRRMNNSPSSHHKPDAFSLPIALKACAALSALGPGKAIHASVIKSHQLHADMFVGAALIDMYAKLSEMGHALMVFEEFPEPDIVLWTSVVTGYQKNNDAKQAISFFSRMVVGNSIVPDPVTLVSLVSALGQLGDRRSGKSCHGFFLRLGFDSDLTLFNSLLNLYGKLGDIGTAKRLFGVMPERDVITWSCMVATYVQAGNAVHALDVYKRMIEMGFEPNSVMVLSVLQACALAFDLEEGRRVHELATRKGFELEVAVSTALIDMYMKCSSCEEAMDLFRRMPKKDVVSWAALISGYAQNGLANESLDVFYSMLLDGPSPDAVTMVKILAACSQLGILRQALCIHGYLVGNGFDDKVFVGAALVDLYSKCGSLDNAVKVFEMMGEKDVVLWSSMIAGFGTHGLGIKAIGMFERMIESSINPNSVTFISILSACSHAGLVEEGRRIFDNMKHLYGVTPNSEHCGIMVDLLARTGKLHEALMLIEQMPSPVGAHVWCALLAGCRIYQNIEMGELVARNLLKLDSNHAGYYMLLSNIYAFDGKWASVAEVKSLMKERGLVKTPGYSSVEVGNKVHTFLAGERLHHEWHRICEFLRILEVKMREEGYVPDILFEMPYVEKVMVGV